MISAQSGPRNTTSENVTARSLEDEQNAYIFPCVRTLYEDPLVVREAHGSYVTDYEGRAYLDLFAGILSTSLGHCHPDVNEEVHRQIDRLGHTSTLYITENQIHVARQLAAIAPGALQTSMFLNSGSEAIDAAITLARLHTGRSEVIGLRHGYSGNSVLATHLTGHAPWRASIDTMGGIKHAMAPYPYRSPFGEDAETNAERFAQDLEEVILTSTSGRPAAFLAETIQGVGGFIVPPPGYFERAAAIIRKYGGLFISDEVQTGFGRTGRHWFGIEHWGVEPDIMVMAKGIANGYPVGAVMTRPDIAASWTRKTISTFGGNPTCMAAARATLRVMEREAVPQRAAERGRQLREGLAAIAEQVPWIGEVRGKGLMQALEIVEDRSTREPAPERTRRMIHAAREQGVLLGVGGLFGHVIRIGPSLLISEDEVAEGLERLYVAFSSLS